MMYHLKQLDNIIIWEQQNDLLQAHWLLDSGNHVVFFAFSLLIVNVTSGSN